MKRTYIVVDFKRKLYVERQIESRNQLVALHELVNESPVFAGDVIEKDDTLHSAQRNWLQDFRKVKDICTLL